MLFNVLAQQAHTQVAQNVHHLTMVFINIDTYINKTLLRQIIQINDIRNRNFNFYLHQRARNINIFCYQFGISIYAL